MRVTTILAAVAATGVVTGAYGDFVVTQSSTQTVFDDHNLTFDEPDVPVGVPMDPWTYYQASDGITFTSGNGFLMAEDWDTLEGIAGGTGEGNQLNGGFNIAMHFDAPVSEVSWQGWANGNGPPFGGMFVVLLLEGVEVYAEFGLPVPFGTDVDSWYSAVGTDGMVFDELRFGNGAFNSFNTYMDNVTFNNVPAPGALALLGLAGVLGGRRRRS